MDKFLIFIAPFLVIGISIILAFIVASKDKVITSEDEGS